MLPFRQQRSGNMASSGGVDTMLFENEEHHGALLEMMKCMYDDCVLADVSLLVQNQKFPCHRLVLAATSPYFKAMFTTDLTESKQQEIKLFEVEAEAVQLIISYAYTGKVQITRTNAQSLLVAASLFQIMPIQKACARFMETQLDVCNCVGVYCFAHIHMCGELKAKAREFMEKNFTEVSQGEEFVNLPNDKMEELISSNELNVDKEEVVYEALVRWVEHDEASRLSRMSKLLPCVRFGLLGTRYIQEKVVPNPLIKKCPKCKKLLAELIDFDINQDIYHRESIFTALLRSGMIKPEHCILMVGGIHQRKPSINCYNPLTRETYCMSDFHHEGRTTGYDVQDPACVVTDDNKIFVAGGNYMYHENISDDNDDDSIEDYEDEMVRKEFLQYDNDHDVWVPKASMLFPKSNFSLAYVNGKIYCFGGLTKNQHPTEIIECYDIEQNRWNYVGMLHTTLVDLSTVVYRGAIYILGGRTGIGAHNVVMRYEPSTAEWTTLAGMPTPRFNFGACVWGDEIFIAGGQIYSQSSYTITRESLSSVEIYNIERNQWRQGPELPDNLCSIGLFVICSSLYACGVTEYRRTMYRVHRVNVIYKLNLVKSKWEQIESDMCDLHNFACVSAKVYTRKLSQVFRPEVDT